MTRTELEQMALALPPAERQALASRLWESLDEAPVHQWQREAIEEALGELEKRPGAGQPAEQVIAELRAKHAGR